MRDWLTRLFIVLTLLGVSFTAAWWSMGLGR